MTCMSPSRRLPGLPRPLRPLAAALALSLPGALALAQSPAPADAPATQQASPPASSALDAPLFYQLLLGELNVRGGDGGAGYSLMLDAARRTQDPLLFRRAVDIALQGRAGDAALVAARAWSDTLPQSQDAYRTQLQILLALNRPAETQVPLERVLALSPAAGREELINAIPQTYARVADKALALRVAREALARDLAGGPHAAAAWTTVGRMELARDARDAALDAARRGQAADPANRLPVLLALQLMEQDVTGAEAVVTRYLGGTPPDAANMRLAYARTLLDMQRLNDARQQLEQLTRQPGGPAEAWLVLGGLQVQNNQAREAQATLETYLQRVSGESGETAQRARTQAYLLLAQAAEKQKDYAAAGRWLDRVENPGEVLAVQLRRASLLARQGKLDEARALIRAQPERLPSDGRAKLMAEAQLVRDLGQYQLAYEVYTRAAARFPDDADVAYEQAMMAEKAGRADEMERILRQLMARQPDHHHAYNALGYSLADRNLRLPEAKALIQKALEFAPGDPYIQDSLGWVEFRMGNTAEALRILQEAYGKRPDAEIAAHLGEVLWVAGQRDRARSIWREGLLLNPDNDTLKETLRRFQVAQP